MNKKLIVFTTLGVLASMAITSCSCSKKQTTPTLQSIEVTHLPNKTSYFQYEEFDKTGLEITAHYSNNSNKIVSEYVITAPDMSILGNQDVLVTYKQKTTSFTISISERPAPVVLDHIAITKEANTTTFNVGDTFNHDGLEITAYYSNNDTKVLSDGEYTISTPNMSLWGEKHITITYVENNVAKQTSYTIMVNAVLNGITISNYPNKRNYNFGEELDLTGLEVKTTYIGGKPGEVINDYTVDESGFDNSVAGAYTIIINWKGYHASFTVSVNAPTLQKIEITHLPNKTVYYQGDVFVSTGLVVIATFSYGEPVDVSDEVIISGYDMEEAGMQEVTVSYTYENKSKEDYFNIIVNELYVVSLRLEGNIKNEFEVGERFVFTGRVIAKYSNNVELEVTSQCQYSGYNKDVAGEYVVTVSFAGASTTFDIVYKVITPIVEDTRYVFNFLSLATTHDMVVQPTTDVENAGQLITTRKDNNQEIHFWYKDVSFPDNNLLSIASGGYISMNYIADTEQDALPGIESVTVIDQYRSEYYLFVGYIGEGEGDSFPFKYADGFSYHTSNSPRRLGEYPSYIAIYNPNDYALDISNIIISYIGNEHRNNPYNHANRFNMVPIVSNYDLDESGVLPSNNDKQVWKTPTFNDSQTSARYEYRLGANNSWSGTQSVNNTQTQTYDIGVDIIIPRALKDVIKVSNAYISYPEGSYLANDETRIPVIEEPLEITRQTISGEDTYVLIRITAKNALVDHRGGPFLYVDWSFDVSEISSSDRSALYNIEYYVTTFWSACSEGRPQIECDAGLEEAFKMNLSTTESEKVWLYKSYKAAKGNPIISYDGRMIYSNPELGNMEEGSNYKITFKDSESYYSFSKI